VILKVYIWATNIPLLWNETHMMGSHKNVLIATEYSFLAGCLENKPKSQISESFASISAFIIIRIHPNRHSGHGETVVAASGSNQTAGHLKHRNYGIYLGE
jgi:hypothetical protein